MGVPDQNVVKPLRVHEFDNQAISSICFDPQGLIVAEREGRLVGFVHAGFGPELPIDPAAPTALARSMGSIVMLVVEPVSDAYEIARELVLRAERYLASRGAEVLYAGSQYPLNPFYWGLYGGSEGSGVLHDHPIFPETLKELGYEPVGTVVFLQLDLADGEGRDPRAILIRRRTQLISDDDPLPETWWEEQALGPFRLTTHALVDRQDETTLAKAATWDMTNFGRADGLSRLGLIGMEVAEGHRRKGYGRFLVSEIAKLAREQAFSLIEVQTIHTNEPALSFYQSLGFHPVAQSTIHRLPASLQQRAKQP